MRFFVSRTTLVTGCPLFCLAHNARDGLSAFVTRTTPVAGWRFSMPEMPHAGEHHREIELIRRRNHFAVFH